MARILLVMPRLPERTRMPYLGQLYLAASLLADGHEVRSLDLSAPGNRADDGETALADAADWRAELVAVTLFTTNAAAGYVLVPRLRGLGRWLVAGGPHATACPEETLEHGFDLSIAGEGELRLVELARAMDGGHSLPRGSERVAPLEDLDALPSPMNAYASFDADAYGGIVLPGGLITSRGCPARCTFCANQVTGRAWRPRSCEGVVAEMVEMRRAQSWLSHFAFWDDAFTARRPRLEALCDAFAAEPELEGITWTCITPANTVKARDLERMAGAGCVGVNFGIESGDPEVLRAIRKGQRPDDVRSAVRAAKDAGMTTVVNFMFGFPGEGVPELERTLELMHELAPATDYFNSRGVLIPMPGTEIYQRWADRYGFRRWWLDPANVPEEPLLDDPMEAMRWAEHDPTLDLDFFRYPPPVRDKIAAAVRFKALHNKATLRRLQTGGGV